MMYYRPIALPIKLERMILLNFNFSYLKPATGSRFYDCSLLDFSRECSLTITRKVYLFTKRQANVLRYQRFGILVDSDLNFAFHVKSIKSKVAKSVGIISKLKH